MIEVNAVRIIVIDNSIFFRDELTDGLRQCLPAGSLVEKTSEPVDALEKVNLFHPDAIVLNYTMSPIQINGQWFINRLREQGDIPIISFGILPKEKISMTRFGIADYIEKPSEKNITQHFFRLFVAHIEHILHSRKATHKTTPAQSESHAPASQMTSMRPGTIMTRASWKQQRMASPAHAVPDSHTAEPPASFASNRSDKKIELIAIGSSTGGTEALSTILKALRPPLPGIVITQHIPPLFAKLFAQRLNSECLLHVKEATDGERVENNTVYISPGNLHMTVHRNGNSMVLACGMGPKVHSCRPSVDVLFDSVAANIGASALGVILTGMGHDGAAGLLKMRKAGSPTIGQDEATCVVYGMPRAAWENGAVERQLPLNSIALAITQTARI